MSFLSGYFTEVCRRSLWDYFQHSPQRKCAATRHQVHVWLFGRAGGQTLHYGLRCTTYLEEQLVGWNELLEFISVMLHVALFISLGSGYFLLFFIFWFVTFRFSFIAKHDAQKNAFNISSQDYLYLNYLTVSFISLKRRMGTIIKYLRMEQKVPFWHKHVTLRIKALFWIDDSQSTPWLSKLCFCPFGNKIINVK